MLILIILMLLITVIQLFVCHFSLWWLIVVVDRLLFSLRIVGATFKVRTLNICEGVAFCAMLIFNMIFSKEGLPWLRLGVFLLLSAISCAIMIFDDMFYVYTVEDDDED